MRNEAELKSLEESIEKLRKEAVVLVNRSKGRLRALYRERPIQDLLSFLFSDKSNNGSRVAFYVSKIRKYDKKLMVRLLAIRQDFAIKANKQREILANNIELENKLIRMHNEEQAQIAKKKETLALLTRKEKQVEKELNELRVQALRIEIVLKSVTTGKELLLETKDIKKKDKEKKDKEKDKDKLKRKIVKPFTGKGLLALKGKLPFPVKGKIVKTFGKHQVKKFKDFVITKGIEFAVANGTQAHAVAKGKVIFDGKMPGYGSMIILDHGERYYTIYSHLINIGAKLGDVLDAGDLVGECDVKEQNNNFYFEIRKDGKPVDPKLYLAS
ncbi:MAG: murein hydrolase activator EnvC family protein [Bdellovibrionota bacterium]